MQGTLRGAVHNVGLGTEVSGTEELSKIHQIVTEGIIGLMTDKPKGYVDIYLQDGEDVSAYRLTVDRVINPDKEMT